MGKVTDIKTAKTKNKFGEGVRHIRSVYHHDSREDMFVEMLQTMVQNTSLYIASGFKNEFGEFVEICSIDDDAEDNNLALVDEDDGLLYRFKFHHYFIFYDDEEYREHVKSLIEDNPDDSDDSDDPDNSNDFSESNALDKIMMDNLFLGLPENYQIS